MRVRVDFSSLKQTKWHEMLVRFVCGGLATVVAGLVAKKYGPVLGGLFLAFPAILPASATLIEKHEIERKQRAGVHGEIRARKAAGIDAAGAALGSIGLLVFAALIAGLLAVHSPFLIISLATLSWLLVSLALWEVRKRT
jgi:Protein of unknown function (DUF3147)